MDLRPETLTWTGLLAQWVHFAQASLALPPEADGPRWRASVPAIIKLQAVTFALADVHRLPHDEQALALDKAELLITAGVGNLHGIWDEQIGDMLREVMDDAAAALVAVRRSYDRKGMTLIAASIAVHEPHDVEIALQRAEEAVTAGANLIEWRIDALVNDDDDGDERGGFRKVIELVKRSPVPCIVTCRAESEGGEFRGDEAARAKFLENVAKADVRPRYIDLELNALQRHAPVWQQLRSLLESHQTNDLSTGLIVSAHDFNGRPADLLQRIEAMTNDPLCSVVKIAWHARSLRDNLEAFDLLRSKHKPMIALCMGQFGLMSRVLAKKFGGLLTFAVDREAEVTAPGQPTIDELLNLYRFDRIGRRTKVYGVIGWPIAHSQSPVLHNAGFEAIGFEGVYLPMPIPPEYEHFKATVGAMIDHAGLDFRGASVTIPHKENLLRFVRERGGRINPLTERIGAANTLVVGSAGGLECLNTDCPAAIESLCDGMGIERDALRKEKIAIIGAGGVGRAICAGLKDCGAYFVIFNRNAAKAARVATEFEADAAGLDQIDRERFDVVINCTPAGMHDGPAPDDLPWAHSASESVSTWPIVDEFTTIFDTVYNPVQTPLIKEAESRGARTITGLDMFFRQAALQFERWTGVPGRREVFERSLRSP